VVMPAAASCGNTLLSMRTTVGAVLCAACAVILAACTPSSRPPTPPTLASSPSYQDSPQGVCRHSGGRPGQQRHMVPPTPVSVSVCSSREGPIEPIGPRHTHDTYTNGFAGLLAALNRRRPTEHPSCDGGGLARDFTLVFHYRTGADVSVEINPDCHPSVTNGTLQSDDVAAVVAQISRLTGLR
jgi:hypothetical protein